MENLEERPERQSASYHLSSATSAAIPGHKAIITPQSPGRGSPLRTTSSKTNMTVGEDIFPLIPQYTSRETQLGIGHVEMLLNVVDHLASAWMNNPKVNMRS